MITGFQGKYLYSRNGTLQPIEEDWQVRTDGDSAYYASERMGPGFMLRVEAFYDFGQCQQMKTVWRGSGDETITAEYSRQQGCCLWHSGARYQELELPGTALWYPLMRIHTGPLISAIARSGGEADVLIPDIRTPEQSETLLKPMLSRRRVVSLGVKPVVVQGQTSSADCYAFMGDQYGDDTRFWIDSDSYLLAYDWPQDDANRWRVERVDEA